MDDCLERMSNLILDGIVFPTDWHKGLDDLRGALGAEVFHFLLLNKRTACVLESVDKQGEVGLHAEKLRECERHYESSDLLAVGKTVKDFPVMQGTCWHTARRHRKKLMCKTGCRRQVELVRLVQAVRVG